MTGESIFETKRLSAHEFQGSDADFLLSVMNQPEYHRYIGDRGLRTTSDAESYIHEVLQPVYEHGAGFWLLRWRENDQPVGFAGIVDRLELEFPDLGYALHLDHGGKGLATEAANGVLTYNRKHLQLGTLLAITDPENMNSINVLTKCEFEFVEQRQVFDDADWLNVYRWTL